MKNWATKNNTEIYRILDGKCNCYLISFNNNHILVDVGQKGDLKKLLNRFDHLGVNNDSLKAVVLTHSHIDHAENVTEVKNRFNVPVICHKNEADNLKTGTSPLIRGTNFPIRIFTTVLMSKPFHRFITYPPVEPDILFENTYDLTDMGFNGYLMHTPGHTPGSTSVILDKEFALVGDTMVGIFNGRIFPPFAADEKQLINSWKILMDTGCSTFLPSHGKERSRQVVQKQLINYRS